MLIFIECFEEKTIAGQVRISKLMKRLNLCYDFLHKSSRYIPIANGYIRAVFYLQSKSLGKTADRLLFSVPKTIGPALNTHSPIAGGASCISRLGVLEYNVALIV